MRKKYRVLFHGLTENKKAFKARIVRLGAPPETVDEMIRKVPVILKEGLTIESSRRYADAVYKAGGIVEIQEHGYFEDSINQPVSIVSFKDFTMCPECGLKQPKTKSCVKCGSRLVNMETGLEPRNVAGN